MSNRQPRQRVARTKGGSAAVSTMNLAAMRSFLSQSLEPHRAARASVAVEFRNHVCSLGFSDRISFGGWIARRQGPNGFARSTVALFPERVLPGPLRTSRSDPPWGLHGACLSLYECGIAAFYCAATIGHNDDPSTHHWNAVQLGLPVQHQYQPLADALAPLGFTARQRHYNFLRYHTDTALISDDAVPEEYSKEHLRIAFNTPYQVELSDIDGIFWGQQHTYPVEIKEKTPADSSDLGPFFGLDVGPFVKLAFYAAKRGNLHSPYVVREIDNEEDRNLVRWSFITFDHLAQFASWIPQAGGPSMGGGRSSVVRVPRCEFQQLTAETLAAL